MINNEKIIKEALQLSHQERAELARLLIDSLHPEKEFKMETSWSKELKERIDHYETGNGSTKPWNKIKEKATELLD